MESRKEGCGHIITIACCVVLYSWGTNKMGVRQKQDAGVLWDFQGKKKPMMRGEWLYKYRGGVN